MKKYSALILILVIAMTAVVVIALSLALRSASRQAPAINNNQEEQTTPPTLADETVMEEKPLRVTATATDTGEVELVIEAGSVKVNAFALRIYVSEDMGSVVFTPNSELTEAGWVYPINEITQEEELSIDIAAAYVSSGVYQSTDGSLAIGMLSVDNLDADLAIDEQVSKIVSKDGKIYLLEFVNQKSTQ